MSRHFLKSTIVMVLFITLVYYGVAWAILSCFHKADHSDRELAAYVVSPSDHDHPNLECVGPKYHAESMAESSSASRDPRSAPACDLIVGTATGDEASDLGLRAVLKTFSLSLPIGTPRYLSLSTLRI